MRRTILLLVGVLLCVVALGSDSPKEYDDKTAVIGIDGTWQLDGNQENLMICHSRVWTIDNGNGDPWGGTCRTDPTRKPAHLDWLFASGTYKGKTFKFIYQIDGDTLRMATMRNDWERPQTFSDRDIVVWTYKRVK